ncbi:MAG: hypothetical protein AB1938_19290 [Myxococcota bacterium]
MQRLAPLFAVLALSCGGGGGPSTDPIPATPLAGTFDGKPWTAAKGTASTRAFNEPGERWIDIASTALSCQSFGGEAQIIGTIPWTTGAVEEFGLSKNVTFVVRTDGGIDNLVATTGRLEVISAPDAGTGAIRLRAKFGSDFSVEGEVQLDVCD